MNRRDDVPFAQHHSPRHGLERVLRNGLVLAVLCLPLAVACSGGGTGSYGSNDPGPNATVIGGTSDTSGVSAGTALQPPSAASPGASPTRAP